MQHATDPVVGIDVAKNKLDVFIDPSRQRFSIDNSDEAIASLARQLLSQNVRLVVVEATGRYHRRLAATLMDAGVPVRVINPQRAREFARVLGRLEKDDRIDAAVLAEFARRIDPSPDTRLPENQTLLRDLVSRRRALVQMRAAEANRATDDLPKLAKKQAARLLRLLDQQIEDLDREIARLIEADDDWRDRSRIIDSVPGIGPDSANQLVAQLPELGKLNRQQIAKLVGVAPLNCQSGKHQGEKRIAGGRHAVRTTLYMLAHNAVMWCDRFKSFYDRLIADAKSHKVALTACMRKLLITLNQMIKTRTLWNQHLQPQEA